VNRLHHLPPLLVQLVPLLPKVAKRLQLLQGDLQLRPPGMLRLRPLDPKPLDVLIVLRMLDFALELEISRPCAQPELVGIPSGNRPRQEGGPTTPGL
jgi:hypothetical protein